MSAFSGAVGHGRNAIGGTVQRFVENTNPSGPGSLAAAIQPNSVVIFLTAGTCAVEQPILITGDMRITLAFQTAPGDGFQLRNASRSTMVPLRIRAAQNVIIRGMRSRPGIFAEGGEIEASYCLDIIDSVNGYIDHSSFSFSDDTAVQFWKTCKDWTIDNSIIAYGPTENLNVAGTKTGTLPAERISIIRSILAHGKRRNPNFNYAIESEVCNCVILNYRSTGSTLAVGAKVDFRGNVLLPGPDTTPGPLYFGESLNSSARFHFDGNIIVGGNGHTVHSVPSQYLSPTPVGSSGYAIMPAEGLIDYVREHCGALPSDSLDRRVLDDLITRTGRWIAHEREVGGIPTLTGVPRPQSEWDALVIAEGGLDQALESFYEDEEPPPPITIDNAYWNMPSAFVGDLVTGTVEVSNAEGLGVSFVVIDTVRGQVDAVTGVIVDGAASFDFPPTEAGTYLFRVTCGGVSSDSPELPVAIRIPAPTMIFTVTPISIRRGQSARLQWSTENMATMFLSGVGSVNLNGTRTVSPRGTTTYTMTGRGNDGSTIQKIVQLRVTVGSNATLSGATA